MSIAEDAHLLGDQDGIRPGRPQVFTRIGLAIKNLDYTQLYRRQALKGIGGALRLFITEPIAERPVPGQFLPSESSARRVCRSEAISAPLHAHNRWLTAPFIHPARCRSKLGQGVVSSGLDRLWCIIYSRSAFPFWPLASVFVLVRRNTNLPIKHRLVSS